MKINTCAYLCLFCISLYVNTTESTAQVLDPTFQPKLQTTGTVFCLVEQSDGKILVGGRFNDFQGTVVSNLIRLLPNGSLDTEFNAKIGLGTNNNVRAISLQSDGKIIAVGDFTSFNGTTYNRLVRLNPDGSVDEAFMANIGSGADLNIFAVDVQPDQKIIIGGRFNTINGEPLIGLARFNSNGTLDMGFANKIRGGLSPNGDINTICTQPDGKILVGGQFRQFIRETARRVIRLEADGSFDDAFYTSMGSAFNNIVEVIRLQPDNKILVGGNFTNFGEQSAPGRFVRLNSNGTRDISFVPPTINNAVFSTFVQPDGRILVTGGFSTMGGHPQNRLARLEANGAEDVTFNQNIGAASNALGLSAIRTNSAKILAGGNTFAFDNEQTSIAARNEDGTKDSAFPLIGLLKRMFIKKIIQQSDNKLLFLGEYGFVDSEVVQGLFRLSYQGALDTEFNDVLNEEIDGEPEEVLLQPDGKVVVVGNFTRFNGVSVNRIVRLNPDGTMDTNFNTNIGSGANALIQAFVFQTNGKLLIGGEFDSFNGTPANRLIRLNSDGTIDNTFLTNLGIGFNNPVYSIAVQSDGKIVVGGSFTSFNNQARNRIVRLNINGTLNNEFTGSGADDYVSEIVVLKDGKMMLSGAFSVFNGIEKLRFVRINQFGGVDNTFNFNLISDGATTPVFISGIQEIAGEEKIIVTGRLENYAGSNRFMVRFNQDGSLDESFDLSSQITLYFPVNCNINEGDLYLSGNFPGSTIRLKTPLAPPTPTNLKATTVFGTAIDLSWESTAADVFFQVQRSDNATTGFQTIATTTSDIVTFSDENVLPEKQYYYRVRAINIGNASVYSQVVGIIISPIITNIEKNVIEKAITISPNPFREKVYLDIPAFLRNIGVRYSLKLYNQLGQEVWEQGESEAKSEYLKLPNISAGCYILAIQFPKFRLMRRIIKY